MSRISITAAVVLAMATMPALAKDKPKSASDAACHKAWDAAARADISCVPLTEKLLLSLKFASRKDVIKAMETKGRIDGDDWLHFVSVADGAAGDLNVHFRGDRAVIIWTTIDGPESDGTGYDQPSTPNIEYIWNSEHGGCSDFPGSSERCTK